MKKGVCRLLRDGSFRKQNLVRQNIVVRWKPGLPQRRDEPWFLMTDLTQPPRQLSELYGRRMTIEELFRDDTNRRSGWALRNAKITQADRIDRLLLILALTYILLTGIGLVAKERNRPSAWCSSNDERQRSVFTIGRILIDRIQIPIATILNALIAAIEQETRKWG